MKGSPLPYLALFFLTRNKVNIHAPSINFLEIEAILDNTKTVINTLDKISSVNPRDISKFLGNNSMTDVKKISEIIENLPL